MFKLALLVSIVVGVFFFIGEILDLFHHRIKIEEVHNCQKWKQFYPMAVYSNMDVHSLKHHLVQLSSANAKRQQSKQNEHCGNVHVAEEKFENTHLINNI